jgi:hypothetical protein
MGACLGDANTDQFNQEISTTAGKPQSRKAVSHRRVLGNLSKRKVVRKVAEDDFLTGVGDDEYEIPFVENGIEDIPID